MEIRLQPDYIPTKIATTGPIRLLRFRGWPPLQRRPAPSYLPTSGPLTSVDARERPFAHHRPASGSALGRGYRALRIYLSSVSPILAIPSRVRNSFRGTLRKLFDSNRDRLYGAIAKDRVPAIMIQRKITTKARSPQYPVIGLGEAIAKVRTIYGRDYQNRIPKEVVAKHLGFTSLHGKSLGVIAALTRYGLLEGRGDDCRVSDRGLSIVAHPPGSRERIEAIQAAASAPTIFQELEAKFPDGRASDEGMRAFLLTNKFIPEAAETAIRSYRETKSVVAAEVGGYDSASVTVAAADGEGSEGNGAERHSPPHHDPPPKGKGAVLMDGERELTTGMLSKGANFRLFVSGPIGVREIERLIRKLEFDKDILAEEGAEPATECGPDL